MKWSALPSIALAALAAASMGGAQAALIGPSFNCVNSADPSAGGTVSWPFTSVLTPTLTLAFPGDGTVSSPLDCSGGAFSETVLARKSGEGQKDFLRLTMSQVFVSGFAPVNDNHLKIGFTQVLGGIVGGVQTHDAFWEITGDYLLSNFDGGFTPFTNFIGIQLHTTQKFDGLTSLEYNYDQNLLTFSAELQQDTGVLSLFSSPRSIDEPATLALFGAGLLAAAAMRRRRRGWVSQRPWSAHLRKANPRRTELARGDPLALHRGDEMLFDRDRSHGARSIRQSRPRSW